MLLPKFQFSEPDSLDEACRLLAEAGDKAAVIAGGTDLLVKMKQGLLEPELVISIARLRRGEPPLEAENGRLSIRPLATKLSAFAISSFYIGVAGAMWAFIYTGSVEALAFEINRSFQILFMIIIGGLGSMKGCLAGGLILALAQLLGAHFTGPGYQLLFGYAVLLIVLGIRPQGIFGKI